MFGWRQLLLPSFNFDIVMEQKKKMMCFVDLVLLFMSDWSAGVHQNSIFILFFAAKKKCLYQMWVTKACSMLLSVRVK